MQKVYTFHVCDCYLGQQQFDAMNKCFNYESKTCRIMWHIKKLSSNILALSEFQYIWKELFDMWQVLLS